MTDTTQNPPEFVIQRVYTKDSSFESPLAPAIFQENIQPMVNLNINTTTNTLQQGIYEVILTATVTAKEGERIIFIAEVKMAGLFVIRNVPEQNMDIILNVTCPTILFPYLREAISELVSRGGFQHLYLAPINFEALYLSNQQKKQADEKGKIDLSHTEVHKLRDVEEEGRKH